jgi:hypothetical protein
MDTSKIQIFTTAVFVSNLPMFLFCAEIARWRSAANSAMISGEIKREEINVRFAIKIQPLKL